MSADQKPQIIVPSGSYGCNGPYTGESSPPVKDVLVPLSTRDPEKTIADLGDQVNDMIEHRCTNPNGCDGSCRLSHLRSSIKGYLAKKSLHDNPVSVRRLS
jgi:hypothetical protein